MMQALISGASSLATYLAGHVLLCLVPALFIAGAISALVPQNAITRFLGVKASPFLAYPVAALGGFFLAVCSCTILPLFASIHRRGAGLGPAVTFLFVGPAINILAVSLTSVQLGVDFAVARLVLSIVFGIGIGATLARIFRDEPPAEAVKGPDPFAGDEKLRGPGVPVLLLSLGVLLAGTLPFDVLTHELARMALPRFVVDLQNVLAAWVPANPSLGVEGLSVHGVLLVLLLGALGLVAWRALRDLEPSPRAVAAVAGASIFVLVVSSLRLGGDNAELHLALTGRTLVLMAVVGGLLVVARRLDAYERGMWLQETWRFTRQIMPLLLVGVFLAGVGRELIPAAAVRAAAGENTILANLIATLFGAVLYFPTLVEVPVAHTLLSLGMHKGPLLAYLMADPELSVQSLLVTAKIIGRKKTAVYVLLIVVGATLAGYLFGLYVSG